MRGVRKHKGEYWVKTTEYVIVNNRAYNPITGLPVENVTPAIEQIDPPAEKVVARSHGIATSSVHASTQRSLTLNRRYVKQPQTSLQTDTRTVKIRNYSPISAQKLTTKQAEPIAKFKPITKPIAKPVEISRPAEVHPLARRATNAAHSNSSPQQQRRINAKKMDIQAKIAQSPAIATAPKPARILKNEAIIEAMNREITPQKKPRHQKQRPANPFARFISIAVPSLAVVLLAGYFTYLSMPNLSIKMAAIQSGVDAKYPSYRPDGYALSGPISFRDGEVSMRFAYSADGGHGFTITQQRSNWNSSALRQSFSQNSEDVTTTTIDGLTIYSQNGRASWVNGGVLYTINGEATLSNSQIQRLATSM